MAVSLRTMSPIRPAKTSIVPDHCIPLSEFAGFRKIEYSVVKPWCGGRMGAVNRSARQDASEKDSRLATPPEQVRVAQMEVYARRRARAEHSDGSRS